VAVLPTVLVVDVVVLVLLVVAVGVPPPLLVLVGGGSLPFSCSFSLAGAFSMTAVAVETAGGPSPALFVAVSWTRIVEPMSASARM